MAELPECERLHGVLRHARFAQPARRRVAMELGHLEAFIPEAIAMGLDLIRLGRADVVIAGGAEACIHPLTLAGFAQARAVSTRAAGSANLTIDRA